METQVNSSPTLAMLKQQQQKQDFESDRAKLEHLATLRQELQQALSMIDISPKNSTNNSEDDSIWLSSRNSSFFRVQKKEQIQPILKSALQRTEDEILELCQNLQERMDEENT